MLKVLGAALEAVHQVRLGSLMVIGLLSCVGGSRDFPLLKIPTNDLRCLMSVCG